MQFFPQAYPSRRVVLAIGVLTFSTWTLARLTSKYDAHLAAFLAIWAAIGLAVGAVLNGWRGAIAGAAAGLVVAATALFYDIFLWLYFTLPPYLEKGF